MRYPAGSITHLIAPKPDGLECGRAGSRWASHRERANILDDNRRRDVAPASAGAKGQQFQASEQRRIAASLRPTALPRR